MLLKLGVDITRLKRQIRRALPKIEAVYAEISGEEVVISSTYEGNHDPGSLHYANLAVDTRKAKKNNPKVLELLKIHLGPNYDVVEEKTHNHVEHDPKNTKRGG
ncbi:hypothetical protein ES702_07340 [subsurface metagenome]